VEQLVAQDRALDVFGMVAQGRRQQDDGAPMAPKVTGWRRPST
jgi:hypothetical protein